MQPNEQSIGALWLKESASGQFFTGEIKVGEQKIRIVVFPNDRKTEEKHPDYRILVARNQGEARPQPRPVPPPMPADDEIPFPGDEDEPPPMPQPASMPPL